MANYTSRLDVAEVGEVRFSLDTEQWAALEAGFQPLNADARRDLLALCVKYLHAKTAEDDAESASSVVALLQDARANASRLASDSIFSRPGRAQPTTLKNTFPIALAKRLINDSLAAGAMSAILPDLVEAHGSGEPLLANYQGRVQVRQSLESVRRIAQDLTAAIADAERRFLAQSDARNGFKPGDAFEGFLRSAKAWAAQHGLRKAESGPLPGFLFALNRHFPSELRHAVKSVGGMAEKFKRANSPASRANAPAAD